jgi:ribosomal protein S4
MPRRGPRLRIVRRLGTPLPGLTRKDFDRRPYPSGLHGVERGRKKSDYRRRLEEKQKVRFADSVEQGPSVRLPDYLARDADEPFAGRMVGRPARTDVPFIVDPTAIVEFYAG